MSKAQAQSGEHAATPKRYRVKRPEGHEGPFGISYPATDALGGGEKYAKEGKIVDDLPHSSIHWLLLDGIIEPVQEDKQPASKAGDDK